MKKAIKINLSGVIFHIDEDAYEKLNHYLKSVELYFTGKAGGKEIVDDIESRIAELFQSRTDNQKMVITIGHVNEVIEIMGDPSDFVEEAEEDEEQSAEGTGGEKKRIVTGPRRLYRDPESSVFGGVCGGLGAYFGIEPVWIRILFVILLIAGYGAWGLVYIILWIAVPRAATVSQRLEMRGERVTLSSIEKTVKEEYDGVKENFKNIEKTRGYKQASSAVEEIFQVLGRIIVVLLKVVAVLIGVAMVFAGFVALLAFTGVFVFSSPFVFGWFDGDFHSLSQLLSAFVEPVNLTIILVALFIAVAIPLFAIIYGGIKLAFQLRTRDSGFGIAALVIWIISLSVLFSMSIVEARKFSHTGISQETVVLDPVPGNILYLELNERVRPESLEEAGWFTKPLRGMYFEPESEIYYAHPSLSIRYGQFDNPRLSIERSARGSSPLRAEINAESISYNWTQTDSLLVFDDLFAAAQPEQWRFEEVILRLNLPEGHHVNIGDNMERIIMSSGTNGSRSFSSFPGKYWR